MNLSKAYYVICASIFLNATLMNYQLYYQLGKFGSLILLLKCFANG